MSGRPVLWIVVPCYNEAEVLPITAPVFLAQLEDMRDAGKISDKSRVLFVNDGSRDGTWEIIRGLAASDPHYIGICLSRNRGHQNALTAGMLEARGQVDCIISIDADGQDDVHAMDAMIDAYRAGSEVVYGVRSSREKDTWFKRTSAQMYYRLLKRFGGDIVYNHADYRLVSSTVLDSFADFREVNLFLRGLFPLIGYRSSTVSYIREERLAGQSHYPLMKMLSLAVDGITSLSVRPIRFITSFGIFCSLFGAAGIVWVLVRKFTGHLPVLGWASTICLILFLGGIQLVSLGVIGAYIGKIYMESKHRPRFIISERTWVHREREYRG